MGASLPGLRMLDPPLRPPSTLAEKNTRKSTPPGAGGPYDNPFWEKSNCGREKKKEEREKTPLIVDT